MATVACRTYVSVKADKEKTVKPPRILIHAEAAGS